ncbi:UDP-glucuronosyltransferase 2B10-like isoform X2 [Gorilla gorilla gorilla]|uniref:UDP-glucuronosyltransferase 2B10-like isoform X2 n=1 Tax=Gorilla gorilla gorilla TaxID=9595 RepID=UPI00123ECDE0
MALKRTETSVLLLIQLSCYFSSGSCGKVLVWAAEYSPWMNMKTILKELVQRGHEVTVLASSASILFDPNDSSTLKLEVYPTSLTKTELENITMQLIKRWPYISKDTFWLYFSQEQEIMWTYNNIIRNFCKDLVSNKKLMKKLQESRFDVVFADPSFPCGELLAELFNIPLVYSHSFSPGYSFERHSGGFIFPPSYVPVVMSKLSDQMTFMERVKNMLYVLYFDFWYQIFDMKKWDHFYSEVLGRPTTLSETMRKADIWLMRNSWNFKFPHPFLPNVDFVGGLHCKPAKPLPKQMEEFVQSSGEYGVVVFSLGSMVSNMTAERANVIATALAKIPQKVLWRFDGNKPDALGLNTRLYKWIPQNDLLDIKRML